MNADAAKWAQLKASGPEQHWSARAEHGHAFNCNGCQAGTASNSWLVLCFQGGMLQLLTFTAAAG